VTVNYADAVASKIFIDEPQNTSYTSTTLSLNFTIEGGNDTILYSLNLGENTTITGNTTFIGNEGSNNTLYLYVNDSAGNLNQSTVSFHIDTITPSLFIDQPKGTYDSLNVNLSLNFTVTENDTIWFNLNLGINTTITGNTTFIAKPGASTLFLYVNDSAGNLNQSNVSFYVNYTLTYSVNETSTFLILQLYLLHCM